MKKIYLLIIFCFMWLSGNAQWYKEYITDEFTNKKEVIMVHKTNSKINAVWFENDNKLKIIFYCNPSKAFNLTFNYCWYKAIGSKEYCDGPIFEDYSTNVLVNNNGDIIECYYMIYYPEPSGYSDTFWSEIFLNMSYEDISKLKFISIKYYDKFFEETVITKIPFDGFINKYKGIKQYKRKYSKKKYHK